MMFLRIPFIAVLLAISNLAVAQSQNWWATNPEDPNREWGRLQEIKGKRLVFLNVAYTSTDPLGNTQQERETIRRSVILILSSHKDLEIVSEPEEAEFAINITASQTASSGPPGNFAANLDPTMQTPLEVAVVVRGTSQRHGGNRPRIVWELASPNVRGNPGSAASFAVDAFIGQLRKLRAMKN
jgi:hypothetical protein